VRIAAEHRHEDIKMRRVLDVAAGRVGRRFGDDLANRRLHFVRIRLRLDPVEIEVHKRLVDAVEILQIAERDEASVAEALRLVRR